MTSLEELKSVVRDTLETRGALGQIKARLRAEVFSALDDQREARPPLSNENLLINELIREYLLFNNYKYAASVLQAESGQPSQQLDRQFLAEELNIVEDRETAAVPLLYGITAHFLSRNNNRTRSLSARSQRSPSPRSARSRSASPRRRESGQPSQQLDRQFLAEELNIVEDRETAAVPLLYGITAHFLSRNNNRTRSLSARSQRSPSPRSARSRSASPRRRGSPEPFTIHGR